MAANKDRIKDQTAAARVKQYATLAYVSSAVAAAMEGSAVEPEALKEFLQSQQDEGKGVIHVKKGEDLFDIVRALIADDKGSILSLPPLNPDPRTMIVQVEDKLFEASIQSDPEGQFKVTLSNCSLNDDGNIITKPITREPIKIKIEQQNEQKQVVAIGPGMEIRQGFLLNRPHQADALLATQGLKYDPDTGEFVANKEVLTEQKDHLIVAGTGTGKTGILVAKTITSLQGGIIVVPDELVNEVVNDSSKFIDAKSKPLVIKSRYSMWRIKRALRETPPRVVIMGHSLLKDYANNKDLQKQALSLAIDEVHQIDPALMLNLKSSNNHITAVTGTPSIELYKIFGDKPTFDMPVHYAQHKLRVIRPVKTSDIEVESDSLKDLAKDALTQHLGRSETAGITINSSQVQGMICTAEDETAKEVFILLTSAKDNAQLDQIRLARRVAIENNMKLDIILAVNEVTGGKKIKRSDLEKKLRSGQGIDKEYQAALNLFANANKTVKTQVRNKINQTNQGPLVEYAKGVIRYLGASEEAKVKVLDDVETSYNEIASLLRKGASRAEIAKAIALYNKGLIMQIVTSGPLKTGFSNTNTLNVTYIQAKARKLGDTKDVVQSLGRPIRAPDVFAFVNTVVRSSIPVEQRCMTAAQVFSQEATQIFVDHLKQERETPNFEAEPLVSKKYISDRIVRLPAVGFPLMRNAMQRMRSTPSLLALVSQQEKKDGETAADNTGDDKHRQNKL